MNKPIYVDERLFKGFPLTKSSDRQNVFDSKGIKFY